MRKPCCVPRKNPDWSTAPFHPKPGTWLFGGPDCFPGSRSADEASFCTGLGGGDSRSRFRLAGQLSNSPGTCAVSRGTRDRGSCAERNSAKNRKDPVNTANEFFFMRTARFRTSAAARGTGRSMAEAVRSQLTTIAADPASPLIRKRSVPRRRTPGSGYGFDPQRPAGTSGAASQTR